MKTKIILLFVILIGFSLVTSNIFAVNTSLDVYAKKKKTTSNSPTSTGSGEKKDTQSTTTDDKNPEKSKAKETETVVNPKLVTTDKTTTPTTPPDTTTTTPPVDCKTSPDDPSCNPQSLATHIDCTKNPDDPSCSTTQSLPQPKPDDDCLFKPSLDKCKPVNGKCPSGFGLNEDEQCFPDKPCPKGFERPDNDETGACLPVTKTDTSDNNSTNLGNSTSPVTDNLTSLSIKNVSKALTVSVSVARDPIVRGNIQTEKVTVSEKNSHNKIAGASVQVIVLYASGSSKNGGNYNGQTKENGQISNSWQISGDATPGTFKVTAEASKEGYTSSSGTTTFTVVPKGTPPPPPPHSPEGGSSTSTIVVQQGSQKYFKEYTDMPTNSPLIITSTFMHKDTLNDIVITGEIKNIGTTTANFVQLISTFYDVNNQTLGNENTYTQPSTLQPSQLAPFTIYLSPNNMPLNKIDHVKYHLEWRRQ